MKKVIKALNKMDLYIEMTDFKTVYPNVIYSDIKHTVENNGSEYWFIIATI